MFFLKIVFEAIAVCLKNEIASIIVRCTKTSSSRLSEGRKEGKKKKERTWSFWFLFETKEAWFTSLYIGSQCYIQCVIFWLLLLFTSSIYIINKKNPKNKEKKNQKKSGRNQNTVVIKYPGCESTDIFNELSWAIFILLRQEVLS